MAHLSENPKRLINTQIAHLTKHGTFIQKRHVSIYVSKYGTFIQKQHIYPKTAHLSNNSTFIQKQHIYPKTAHLSENGSFIQKQHIYPKKFICFLHPWKSHEQNG